VNSGPKTAVVMEKVGDPLYLLVQQVG